MAAISYGATNRPPEILFLHATGLNGLAYRELLEPLGAHFHVVAVDARGHGRSKLPRRLATYSSWNRHRDDIVDLISRHFPAAVTLAGHSMGATVGMLVAGKRPDLVRGVCAIEPVILAPGANLAFNMPGVAIAKALSLPLAAGAMRRRKRFESKQAAIEALTGRGFFKTWSPEALADYVDDGFVEDAQGVTLACTRYYEARTFAAQGHDTWRALQHAPGPIVVLRAEHGSPMSEKEVRRLAARRPDIRLATIEDSTHALPMEKPDRVRAAIESTALLGGGKERYLDLE
jgi:pimeloyl-ACP methyl ester carboxylesterase